MTKSSQPRRSRSERVCALHAVRWLQASRVADLFFIENKVPKYWKISGLRIQNLLQKPKSAFPPNQSSHKPLCATGITGDQSASLVELESFAQLQCVEFRDIVRMQSGHDDLSQNPSVVARTDNAKGISNMLSSIHFKKDIVRSRICLFFVVSLP